VTQKANEASGLTALSMSN